MNTAHKDDLLEDQPTPGMDEAFLERLAELVAEKVAQKEQPSLWGVREIAAYLKLSERHVQDRVVKSPKFPKGFIIPGAGKIKGRIRWRPNDILEWSRPK